MSEQFVVNVETAVHRDGEYLLAERAATEDHAAGKLSLVGGTVERDEGGGAGEPVLAATARRELREEVGVEVAETVHVTSSRFVDDGGAPVINIVLLGRHEAGDGEVREPEEVADVSWYEPEAVAEHQGVPPYTREYVAAGERRRRELGW